MASQPGLTDAETCCDRANVEGKKELLQKVMGLITASYDAEPCPNLAFNLGKLWAEECG